MLPDLEYEKRTLDQAREILRDIEDCVTAEYNVRWIEGAPHLVLGFVDKARGRAIPAFAIRLSKVPSNELLEGDRLRRHVRGGIEQYLFKHGIVATVKDPQLA